MWPFTNKFSSITTTQLKELLSQNKKNIEIIDVRSAQEYKSGHIRQAKNQPLNRIQSYKGSQDKELYVICQSGMRSRQAAKILQKNGYRVTNVKGGMSAWAGSTVVGK